MPSPSSWLAAGIRLHRALGLVAALTLLCFAGSGLIHPLMSRLQPQPVSFAPPALHLAGTPLALPAVLEAQAIDTLRGASLTQVTARRAAYRIEQADGAVRYFDAASGAELPGAERRHAIALARHFSGERRARVVEASPLARFDSDYLEVNRLLPVWRVRFERGDGLTAYVDTAGNRLATLVDNDRRRLQALFRSLHGLGFLEGAPRLRELLVTLLLATCLATALAGLLMWRLPRPAARLQRLPLRRWHRRLALPMAVALGTFVVSGLWHLLHRPAVVVATPAPPLYHRAELGGHPLMAPFTLVRVGDQPCYRVALPAGHGHDHHHGHGHVGHGEPAQCFDSANGTPLAAAESRLAEALARAWSGSEAALATLEPVTRFSDEYGFINKRLPVWRVQFADAPARWYVETATGALALRADDSDAREGWTFANLHKWSFFGSHTVIRDILLSLTAALLVTLSLLGLRLRWPRRRR